MTISSENLLSFKFVLLLILALLLESAGYIAFPFLTIRLTGHFGYTAQEAGSIMLLAFWSRPLASIVVTRISAHVSVALLSVISCLCEAIAFLGLAYGEHKFTGGAALILGNIGLALWVPGLFAAVYNDKTHSRRGQRISLLNGALNGGLVVGCLGGALLVKVETQLAFLIAGIMYFLLSFPIYYLMKPNGVSIPVTGEFPKTLTTSELLSLSLFTICSWATLSQFTIYVGLLARDYLKDESFTGIAFSVSGMTILLVSIYLARQDKLESKLLRISCIGLVVAVLGWAAVSLHSVALGLIMFVVCLSFYEGISVIAIADRWSRAGGVRGQSMNYTVRCLGQGLGGFIGGSLYISGGSSDELFPWIYANWFLLFVAMAGLLLFEKFLRMKEIRVRVDG
jgi:hypothetical protein